MSGPAFRVGLVQMRSGLDPTRNITDASRLIGEAVRQGAQLVVTPEMTNIMESRRSVLAGAVADEAADPAVRALADVAKAHGVHLLAGSLALRHRDRFVNRALMFAPDGRRIAAYDKIHLFDVDLPNGDAYRESATYDCGGEAVLAGLPWGVLGLTICYDVRFPQLYRALAKAGADFIAAPAAFTRVTGEAHWHVLVRARAIETGAFVFAAAQGGRHENGRETYGHSLVVSPWGEVLAEAGTEPGVIVADIDPAQVALARSRIPALRHDRPFAGPAAIGHAPVRRRVS